MYKITSNFKEEINKKRPNFYRNCIPTEEEVNIILNGSNEKSGSYICQTCKTAMKAGKIPSMSIMNGLHLTHIEDDCKLTELENNLIAQNINFQYIFHLDNGLVVFCLDYVVNSFYTLILRYKIIMQQIHLSSYLLL